ncbi:predicted protein [Naegleria gruberi]|uniref:Predicted protein n=1 Tax=Naegleria gruberi TaxID=5762 RepID=D2VKN9_NAEGR|nr:uncharacterized protein NAEGRDRAFT_69460 [Naegleria gruberi]EFC42723.1 predicted protein [Naegleria gruberi]|eukprot:XP_002675467.1 predicted protein [Naegleria gruberi strain NEG-M]
MKELVNEHLFKLSAQQLLLKVILASEEFHLNFLKLYKRVNHAELINDWILYNKDNNNKENDLMKEKEGEILGIKIVENYYRNNDNGVGVGAGGGRTPRVAASSSTTQKLIDIDEDHKLFRRSKIKLLNQQYCAMMEECLTFQIVDTIETIRIDFEISLIESESLKFPGTLTMKGYFTFKNIEEISHLGSSSSCLSPRYSIIVSIYVLIEYKVMFIGSVTSIEEKLYGECKKLFDLWFDRLKIVENEVRDSVFNINTFNRDADLNASIDEKQILNSTSILPIAKPIITREILNDWNGMNYNIMWENETSPFKLPVECSSTELKDMEFEFLIQHPTPILEEEIQIEVNNSIRNPKELEENPKFCCCVII